MADFLNNGLSGLLAAQRALQVTSNNVANVNTEGFSRQRVDQVAIPGLAAGDVTIGAGTQIVGVSRIYDQFLAEQLNLATNGEQRARTFNELSTRLDGLLGNPDTGVNVTLGSLFDAVDNLSRDATSLVARQQVIEAANAATGRFNQMSSQLNLMGQEVGSRLNQSVLSLNTKLEALAALNEQIMGYGANPPNGLLDQRDTLVRQLSESLDINVIPQADGRYDVLLSSGQPLVLGTRAFELTLQADRYDPTRQQLAYTDGSTTQVISGLVAGGTVGGLLSFRNDVLDPAQRELGRLAAALGEGFNARHRQGLDLNGDQGGDLFGGIVPQISVASNNTGAATVTASIADISAVEARDYLLDFDGAAWSLRDVGSGAPVSLTGTGTAGDPFVAEGLEIIVTGAAAAGDSFQVRSMSRAAGNISVVISDPTQIAAASPVVVAAAGANASSATTTITSIDDPSDPGLLQSVTLEFIDPASYRILDGSGTDLTGPVAWAPGDSISFNGWTAQVAGAPTDGDRFNIDANTSGSGDNSNALIMAAVQFDGILQGGVQSVSEAAADLVAIVGSAAFRSEQDLAVQTSLREQLELDMEGVSGVKLEEEAVNLLRYQEAYLASSKIITVANDLFQTVLNAVR